jgi:cytochrome P450
MRRTDESLCRRQPGRRGGEAAPRPGEAYLTVRSHAEVVRIACDPERFSNAVSRFVQLPNGLDGCEHARFRSLIDRYFTPGAMAEFAPSCRGVAREIVASLPRDRSFDAVTDLGVPFAVRAQSVWLGWPTELEPTLIEWLGARQRAVRSGDRELAASVAVRFDEIVRSVVAPRLAAGVPGDVTARLVQDRSLGRALEVDEIVSILRNWTGGDLGSMALAVGVVVHDLAARPALAVRLRGETSDERFDLALEECLRLEDPFVASRRVVTGEAEIAGTRVSPSQRLALDWAAANRDPVAFARHEEFDPEAHAAGNLVYGIGPHVCPGRPLARLELRELVRSLLEAAPAIALDGTPIRESAPLGGFRSVPARLLPARVEGPDATQAPRRQ